MHTAGKITAVVLMPLGLYAAYLLAGHAGIPLRLGLEDGLAVALAGLSLGSLFLLRLPLSLGARLALVAAYFPLGLAVLTVLVILLVCSLGLDCL